MDGSRFDALTRSLVASGSRRRLLGGIAAGALGLVGLGRAEAAICRDPGRVCSEHVHCCSKLCGPKDATGRRRCWCQSIADCPAPNQCHTATCVAGICGKTVLVGQLCNDNNVCTTGETCQANGACGGGAAVLCIAQDQCHSAACQPATGCVQTPLSGTACNADNSLCTQNDTCQNGVCVPGTAVVCTPLDQCHDAGTCDSGTGLCSNPNAPNGTGCENPDLCITGGSCQDGTCTGGTPVACSPLDQCHDAGTCDSGTGQCSNPNAPNGTGCENPAACITGGTCQDGTCTGGTTVPNNQQGGCPSGQFCCGGACCGQFCASGSCICLTQGTACNLNSQCCGNNCVPQGGGGSVCIG